MDDVLLATGERPFIEVTDSVQSKVRNCVITALNEVSLASDWPWLAVQRVADSWSTNVATVSNVVEMLRVAYIDSVEKVTRVIPEQTFVSMNMNVLVADGYPTRYARFSDTLYYFDATPIDTSKIQFFFNTFIPIPPTDDSLIQFLPLHLEDLVKYKARANFAIQHLSDSGLSQECTNSYLVMLNRATAVGGRLQNRNISMYRGAYGSTRII